MTRRQKKRKATKRTARTKRTAKRAPSALSKAVAQLSRALASRDRKRTVRAAVKVQLVAKGSRAKSARKEASRARRIERGAQSLWTVSERNRAGMELRNAIGSLYAPLPQELDTPLSGHRVHKPKAPTVADAFLPVEKYQEIFGDDPSNVKGINVVDADTGHTTWIRLDRPLTHWADLYAELSARYKQTGNLASPYGK